MAYQRWFKTVRDQQGNAINGASCTVYEVGTSTIATVYDPNSDDSSPSPLSNPFVTTSNGRFGFMAIDGEYDVVIQGGSLATQSFRVTLSSSSLYLAPYTGAVARTQAGKNGETISVLDFGAVGDGIADDTAAIQSAFTNVPDGCTIYFPAGTYKVTGATDITRTVSGNIIFDEGAVIDASTSTASNVLSINGSLGTAYVNVAAITSGDSTLTVNPTLAATLTKGDILLLSTNTYYGGDGTLWNPGRAYYWKGELVEVLSVAGSVVTAGHALLDSYGASSAAAMKVNYVTAKVYGLRVKAGNQPTQQSTLQVQYGKNILIHGGETNGSSVAGVAINYTHGFVVDSFTSYNNGPSSLGYSYGVDVGSCQYGQIVNCNLSSERHAVSLGGFEPTRYISISNCTLDSDPSSLVCCADAHGNTDFITYYENNILNGMTLSAQNCRVINNWITGKSSYAVALYSDGTMSGGSYFISGNSIVYPISNPGSVPPITFYAEGTLENITIKNNNIQTNQAVTSLIVAHKPATTLTVTNFDCLGNTFKTSGGGAILFADSATTNVNISSNTFSMTGVVRSVLWGATALSSYVDYCDNIHTSTTHNAYGWECPATVGASAVRCNRNYMRNIGDTFYIANLFVASSYAEFTGNILENATNGLCNINAPDILIKDNRSINVSGASTLTGRYFNEISTPTGVVKTYAAAAPTTGTWKVGDVCVQLTPAVGQPKGWRCTVAGTPGTWVSEGNL